MSAGVWNIDLDQGATLDETLTYRDSAGELVDLTGYDATLVVKDGYGAVDAALTLAVGSGLTLGGAAGTVRVVISAAQSAAFLVPNSGGTPPTKVYVYDLKLTLAGAVSYLVRGSITVSRTVS